MLEIREKRQCIVDRIQHLKKSHGNKQKKLEDLEKELMALEEVNKDKEMEMGDYKRFILREAFYTRFNAQQEYAEKLSILAGFGKYVTDLIDIEPTPSGDEHRKPYTKYSKSSMIIMDALLTVDGWRSVDERPTFVDILEDDEEEEDASLLTDNDIHLYTLPSEETAPTKKSLFYSSMKYPHLYGSMSDIQKNPNSRPYSEFQNQYQDVYTEKDTTTISDHDTQQSM